MKINKDDIVWFLVCNPWALLVPLIIICLIVGGAIRSCAQAPDSMYCIPLPVARKVIEDAAKKHEQDTTIVDLRLRLVKKHMDFQNVQREYGEYRARAERIRKGSEVMNSSLEQAVQHWQTEAIHRERIWKIGRWGIPAGFMLGMLVVK